MPPALELGISGTTVHGNYNCQRITSSGSPSQWSRILEAVLGRARDCAVTAAVTKAYDLTTCPGVVYSPKLRELQRQLDALDHLKKGWDSYDAEPPNKMAVENARRAFEEFSSLEMGVLPTRISASVEGGVGFVFRRADRYVDIEFFNSGETVSAASEEDGRSDVRDWSGNESAAMIDWIRRYIE